MTAPIKTPEGLAELATRVRRLSQRHRTLLLLVDGRRSVEQVQRLAGQAGVPPSCFGELLDMGLIVVPRPPPPLPPPSPGDEETAHVDLPLFAETVPEEAGADESVLPSVHSLQPESTLNGELGPSEPWAGIETGEGGLDELDPALEEARDMLLRAVRAEAPVAGSLTLMRLRRARTRADLEALLDEVDARLRKPHRALATTQLLRRVRLLLGSPVDSSLSSA